MEANTKYLSAREVADRLGVSVMTVGRWLKSGKLNGYKFGKTMLRRAIGVLLNCLMDTTRRNLTLVRISGKE